MTIGDRIKKLREEHGLTQEELAWIAGVSNKAVSTWENNLNIPRMGAIQRIADHFGITKSSLIEDTPAVPSNLVQLPKKPTLPAADQSLLDKYHILDAHGKAVVDTVLTAEYSRCAALEYETVSIRRYVDPSAAGEPLWAEGEYEMVDYEKRLVPKGTDYAVGISGHSMEPTLMDGSTVFVRKTQDIVDGDVIIAWIEGEGTVCKRALVENGKLVKLTSDNPEYGGIEGECLNSMRVYGKVIGYLIRAK